MKIKRHIVSIVSSAREKSYKHVEMLYYKKSQLHSTPCILSNSTLVILSIPTSYSKPALLLVSHFYFQHITSPPALHNKVGPLALTFLNLPDSQISIFTHILPLDSELITTALLP